MRNLFKKKLPTESLMLPPTQRLAILQKEIEIENQRAWDCLRDAQSLGVFTLEIPYPENAQEVEVSRNDAAHRIIIRYKLRGNLGTPETKRRPF